MYNRCVATEPEVRIKRVELVLSVLIKDNAPEDVINEIVDYLRCLRELYSKGQLASLQINDLYTNTDH